MSTAAPVALLGRNGLEINDPAKKYKLKNGLGWGCVACPRCAYARADWLGLHLRRLHHCALCQ